jgi:hypothetical protein
VGVLVTTVGKGPVNTVLLPRHHSFALANVLCYSFFFSSSGCKCESILQELGGHKGQLCIGFGGMQLKIQTNLMLIHLLSCFPFVKIGLR